MHQWIAVIVLACCGCGCGTALAGEVDQAGAVSALREGKPAIDVRPQTAYEAGTVLNAIRVDKVRQVNQRKQVLNDRNVSVVIFSSIENASKAQDRLIRAGYSGIIDSGDYEELHNALYDTSDDPAE